jgi:hypothetical protein
MGKAIYKMEIDFGRQGELTGVFVAEKSKVVELIELGQEVYFGEVLGKHSDVNVEIEDGHITMITDNEEAVKLVEEHGLSTGYDPFDYI